MAVTLLIVKWLRARKTEKRAAALAWQRNENFLLGVASVTAFLLFWEFSVSLNWVNPLFTSSPSRIAAPASKCSATAASIPTFWSARRIRARFGLAVIVGVPLGILMAGIRG